MVWTRGSRTGFQPRGAIQFCAMNRTVRFTIGDIEVEAVWGASPTADALYDALPLDARGSYWGGEIYFDTPVRMGPEPGASDVVEPGAVAYWPPGHCLCIFWGPTPASEGDECRAANPVNVVGHIDDLDALERLRSSEVRVEAG